MGPPHVATENFPHPLDFKEHLQGALVQASQHPHRAHATPKSEGPRWTRGAEAGEWYRGGL